MKYLLVDVHNMFHRCRHVIRADSPETKGSMALHLIFNSIRKGWRQFNADHLVLASDGSSWRKELYPQYKANRTAEIKTQDEIEDDRIFFGALHGLTEFFQNRTNCTFLYHQILEADDLVARWIQRHPDDEHVIISSDSDFKQLIASNVTIYDGMKQETITLDGIVNDRGDPIRDKKTGDVVPPPNPEWLLFEKCIRGDSSDNIFSAYPGVRKNVIKDAFDDRERKGFCWNNLMNHEWNDHNKQRHTVKADYERNRSLIDLSAQPQVIIEFMDSVIDEAVAIPSRSQVGTQFLRFCGKYDLSMLSKGSTEFADILVSKYSGHLTRGSHG